MLPIYKELNNFSPELRKKLNDELTAVGKIAKYKFYIARKNPDPEHKPDEAYLYPTSYTLTPVTYEITDGMGKPQVRVGLYDGIFKDKDLEEIKFKRVSINARDEGLLTLDLRAAEHRQIFEYLEMHPKNENGLFRDKNIPALFCRIDELKEAKTRLLKKEMRGQTIMVASRMGEQEVRNFAAAMNWNELEDYEILKDKMIELADKDPEFFRQFVDDPAMEYRAIGRRAIDANIISWSPVECKFTWTANNSVLAVLDRTTAEKYIDGLADWLITSKNGPEVFKKIKALLSGKTVA